MTLITSNTVLFHDYTKGHLSDLSGKGNDATQSSNSFKKAGKGLASVPELGELTVVNDSTLDLSSTGFTVFLYANFERSLTSGDRFFYKAGAYDFFYSNTSTIAYSDGTTTYNISASKADYSGDRVLCLRKTAASGAAEVFIDLDKVVAASGSTVIGSSSNPLYIGNALGLANQCDIDMYAFLMDAEVLSDEEVVRKIKALKALKTTFKQKRNFYTGPSVGVPLSGSAWNTKLVDGKVIDQNSANGYDGEMTTAIGSITGTGLIPDKMPWGEPALRNSKGNNGHLNMGASANINFTSGTFGYIGWFRPGNTGNEMLMSKSGTQFLQAPGTGQLQISLGGGAYTAGKLFQFEANQGILAGFLKTPDTEYCMLNGEELFSQAAIVYGSGGTLRIGQYVATGFDISGLIGPQVAFRRFDSTDEYFALARQESLSKAKLPIIKDTLKDSFIHATAQGVGPLNGTPYYVESGTFKVNIEVIDGVLRKIIECVTPGVLSLAVPDYAFGTWNYLINKADASTMNIQFVSDGRDFSTANGYRIRLDSSETIFVQKVASGTPSTQASMTSAITAGEWTNVKQERDNYFTTYIDGVEMAETSGTHPFQERTTTKNTFQLFDMDAGDKFTDDGLVLHKFGII